MLSPQRELGGRGREEENSTHLTQGVPDPSPSPCVRWVLDLIPGLDPEQMLAECIPGQLPAPSAWPWGGAGGRGRRLLPVPNPNFPLCSRDGMWILALGDALAVHSSPVQFLVLVFMTLLSWLSKGIFRQSRDFCLLMKCCCSLLRC